MKRKIMCMTGISLSLFLLFGCAAVERKIDTTKSTTETVSSLENKTDMPENVYKLKNAESSIHDGVYRTYSLGEFFSAGTLVTLESEMLLDEIDSPDTICVYYYDELYKTISYENEDEELELKDSGNYAFFVFDKNGDYVDITDKIDYLVPASENGIIYVQ